MLIAAYVFIGQQSHMSDMPLLHVICTTVKGNRSPSLTEAHRRCGRWLAISVWPPSTQLFIYWWRSDASTLQRGEKMSTVQNATEMHKGLKGPVFYPVESLLFIILKNSVFSPVFTACCCNISLKVILSWISVQKQQT